MTRSRIIRTLLGQLALLPLGAVLGTLCDRLHVRFGVLWYPHPSYWLGGPGGQAAWVPPLFAGAALVLVNGYRPIGRWFRDDDPAPRWRVVLPLAWFVAAYLATALLGQHPRSLTALLVLTWLGRVMVNPHRGTVVYAITCAIAGPAFEAALSSTGAFFYTRPDWVVPAWLPALYLHLAPLVRHIHAAFFRDTPLLPGTTAEPAPYLSFKNLERE
jgi:hypothetical protein